ncbi:peptidase M23 [Maritimibacter sp. 55A14]|uniref:murein hydrolase activator EnvC family protein n=1 Tax=Maritimibacter sp. 55A14 TaxID=2174844 RepID=UPI000D605545|nr:peptidoglycan DD-metalloendopeptidase family protein [Maritimibacter sp. 55A14]PWE29333.1 peptidase M23 [Maritimibacter sp. 55A14]
MTALRAFLAALLIAAPALPAAAGTAPEETARRAAAALEAAARRLEAADTARDRVAALTETIRAYEDGLSALREGIRQAAMREGEIHARFDARRAQVARLLGVLQSVQRAPAPLLMLHPSGALGTARSAMMVSEVTPSLQAEAESLRARLEEVHILQALQETAAEDLRAGLAGVQAARAVLSKAVADRTDLPRHFIADPERMRTLAESAQTLESFAASLPEPETAAGGAGLPPAPRFEAAKGSLPLPAPGTPVRGFGEADAAGIARPGMILNAPPRALVTAPCPGTIRYRGPLLDYGNVMILEPASGYLLVIAGLETVYGEVGDILPAGAPLGFLGGEEAAAEEFLLAAGASGGTTGQETLYIEIRHDQVPVDPAEWFALKRE